MHLQQRKRARLRGTANLTAAAVIILALGPGCTGPEPAPQLPPVETVQQKTISEFIDQHLPPEIKDLVAAGKDLVGIYKGVTDAVGVAEALGRLTGLLPDQISLDDAFNRLEKDIRDMGVALSTQMSQTARDERISAQYGAIRGGQEGTLHVNDAPDALSRNAAEFATSASAFNVVFSESSSGTGRFGVYFDGWKGRIPDRPTDVVNGLVWDWRAGLPHLVEMVGLRLQVMALINKNFIADRQFDPELRDYGLALIATIDKMTNSVRCSDIRPIRDPTGEGCSSDICDDLHWFYRIACADIYSGMAAFDDSRVNQAYNCTSDSCAACFRCSEDGCGIDQACVGQQQRFNESVNNDMLGKREELRRRIINAMPFVEAQATVDTISEILR
jgi:hypothetical protein